MSSISECSSSPSWAKPKPRSVKSVNARSQQGRTPTVKATEPSKVQISECDEEPVDLSEAKVRSVPIMGRPLHRSKSERKERKSEPQTQSSSTGGSKLRKLIPKRSNKRDKALTNQTLPSEWDSTQVAEWLKSIGFDPFDTMDFVRNFQAANVTGANLFELGPNELDQLGLKTQTHQSAFLKTRMKLRYREHLLRSLTV